MESRDGKQTDPVHTVTSGNLWTAVIFLGGLRDRRKTMDHVHVANSSLVNINIPLQSVEELNSGPPTDKFIQWQGGGFELGTSRLQVQHPNH